MWPTWDADIAICVAVLLEGECGAHMDWRIPGFHVHGDFTVIDRDLRVCLPDMELLRSRGTGGRPQTRRIINNMDEVEVGGPIRRCTICDEYGHKAKYCPKNAAGSSTTRTSVRHVVHDNLGDQDRFVE